MKVYKVEVYNSVEWGIKEVLKENTDFDDVICENYPLAKAKLISILKSGRDEYAEAVRQARKANKDYFNLT